MDRANLQKEVSSLSSEIDRIAESANFNGIKLLNGDLGKTELNSYSKNNSVENLADGITIDAPVDGAGLRDEFTIGYEGLFGAGDSVTFQAVTKDATTGVVTTQNIQLNYGTDFNGADKETQMTDLATALGTATDAKGDAISDNYDIEVVASATDDDGNATDWQIKLTAKSEGISETKLSVNAADTSVVDNKIIVSAQTTTVGANGTNDAANTAEGVFTDLLGGSGAGITDLRAGDELKFSVNVQGKAMTITLKADEDFDIASTIEDTTANLATALQNASFDDDPATGIDESQLKVNDYFTINANKAADGTTTSNGSIQIAGKTGAGIATSTNEFTKVDVEFDRDGSTSTINATGPTHGAAGAGATNAVSEVKFDNAFMKGDSFTLRGTLSDGLSFEVTLEAGKDFEISNTKSATMDNIIAALSGPASDKKVNVVKGGETVEVAANQLFGAGKEFTLGKAAGTDDLTITSATAGAGQRGGASVITSANSTIAAGNTVSNMKVEQTQTGKVQSNTLNTLTFDRDKIEQGTTITIGGKTYEFVNDDGTDNDYRTNSNNVAIKVANLNKRNADGNLAADAASNNDIAKAAVKALDSSAALDGLTGQFKGTMSVDGANYNISVDAGSSALKIVSVGFGTGNEALKDIEISSRDQNTSVIKFNTETTGAGSAQKTTANVKVGDTITIDGKTYEFTDGEHRTEEEGNVAVALNIKDGYTAEDAAKALADAINANTKSDVADGKPGGVIATVGTVENKDGSRSFAVNVTSKYNDTKGEGHEYDAPVVEIPTSGKGLTLQVGETSEEFQKVNVAIDRMDAEALGIGGISVGKQEDAAAAIDKIKAAINTVSATRGDLGAIQNRLEHTINNLGVTTENMTAAESRIRDTDMAKEMMEFTKNNILVQASQAMLAQANQLPQGVLQLLQ